MKKLLIALLLLSNFAFIGCDDDEDKETSLFNEWVLDEGNGDVWYLEMTKTAANHYDYMGDSYDEGDDCYDNWSVQISVSGNTITVTEDGETYALTYAIDGDILTITEVFEGETWTQKWKRQDFDQSSFTSKECTFKTNPALSKKGLGIRK